jgi:hypothetical protein
MADPDAVFAARARQAYERGRLWAALPVAAVALPMTALSVLLCGREAGALLCGALLAAVLLAALWRGQDYGRGARTGLLAGLGPFALPLAAQCSAHACLDGTCLLYPAVCIGAGALAGIAVAVRGLRGVGRPGSWGYAAPAFAAAALAGSLGCVMAGTAGVVGMMAGMAVGAAPLLLRPSPAGR